MRSISTDRSRGDVEEAKASMKPGGNSLVPTARADLGARVTGEANPLVNSDTSSVEIRSDAEERSNLKGIVGR